MSRALSAEAKVGAESTPVVFAATTLFKPKRLVIEEGAEAVVVCGAEIDGRPLFPPGSIAGECFAELSLSNGVEWPALAPGERLTVFMKNAMDDQTIRVRARLEPRQEIL